MRSSLFRAVLLALLGLVIPRAIEACPIGVFDDRDVAGKGGTLTDLLGENLLGTLSADRVDLVSYFPEAIGSKFDPRLGSRMFDSTDMADSLPLLELASVFGPPQGWMSHLRQGALPGLGHEWVSTPSSKSDSTQSLQTLKVPEPSTMTLLGVGFAALLFRRRN